MIFIGMTSTIKNTFDSDRKPQVDENLIIRLASGERQALAELYVQTDSAVYGFALSILKDHHLAEDVMHDAYLKINEAAVNYKPMGKPMAWILTIVRNLSLMKLRQAKNKFSVPLDESFDLADSRDLEKESTDRVLLSAVMQILSDEERQIVTLYAISGMKHREIASVMGMPLATVLSKYRRSLVKLKKYMEAERNEK